ncbi:hypothetical protein MKW92_049392, partial [Papaver armeniacum]
VKYEDGDCENVTLSTEKIKFYLSREEMRSLNRDRVLRTNNIGGLGYDEMLVLVCFELELGI